ncbi:MAG TPA: thiamine phosphate synthase [Gemmatimonadota bacterium]|nr:thiamine phosphate synthase [Gemmatimonadota bacterium]
MAEEAGGSPSAERASLGVMVLTHPAPASGRPLADVVSECLEAGATAIQLRDKEASDEELYQQAVRLVELTRAADALLIVNDRFDVALAAGADGVHLGPEDLPVDVVRLHAGDALLIGYSTDSPVAAVLAANAGADYLGVGAVYETRSKDGLEHEAIGPERVGDVLHAAGLPGVGIGGITPDNAADVLATGAGVAVLSAVMHAERPGDVVRQLAALAESAASS